MKHKSDLLAKAQEFVFTLFKEKLSPKFLYHNYKHTLEVVGACQDIAGWYKLEKEQLEIILLAAWFHDTGYAVAYDGHEDKSIEIARDFLTAQGCESGKIDAVCNLILSTSVSRKPASVIEEIIHDADYITMGKKSFFERAELLRIEWEVFLKRFYTDSEWAKLQLEFLLNNTFYTEFALKEWGAQRGKNIEAQRRFLDKLKSTEVKRSERTGKEGKPGRGVETMYRATYRNHIELSAIADSKANMMISINTIIMSVIISVFGSGVTFIGGGNFDSMRFALPMCTLLLTSLSSVIFAVLSAKPNVTQRKKEGEPVPDKKSSLLFFGNFSEMQLDNFVQEMNTLKGNEGDLYNSMSIDIYYLGKVLRQKYRLLRISYLVFMAGLILSVLVFMVVFFGSYKA